ncbi:MAG: ABC transporter permease [Candidatus Zhuqueibacterota bacterium]
MIFRTLYQVYGYRELLYALITRDIKVRYKQSLLGVCWALLQPLALMIIFTIVFSRFASIATPGIPYPIFSYCALLPWTFFSTSLSFAIPSLVNNITLITKIYFPREIFPIAAVAACFFDFLVASLVFVGMMVIYHVAPTMALIFLPILLAIQIVLTLGIALFASAANVFFRDIRYVVPLALQIWLFLSPVIYPLALVPEKYRSLYLLNPMAVLIDGYRTVVLNGMAPSAIWLAWAALISFLVFAGSYLFFKKIEMRFADLI